MLSGGVVELLLVVLLWLLIFNNLDNFGNYTFKEIITYILIGNAFGYMAGFAWGKIIKHDIGNPESKMLIHQPFNYLFKIIPGEIGKFLTTAALLISLNLFLLNLFFDTLPINLNATYLILILAIILLSFIFEFLLAYLIHLHVFWTIESPGAFRVIMKFRKMLAGAYFPLSLLPAILFKTSLFLPFAYSFYIPTQLYLKEINIKKGFDGIIIQLFWILVVYILIKITYNKKLNKLNNK